VRSIERQSQVHTDQPSLEIYKPREAIPSKLNYSEVERGLQTSPEFLAEPNHYTHEAAIIVTVQRWDSTGMEIITRIWVRRVGSRLRDPLKGSASTANPRSRSGVHPVSCCPQSEATEGLQFGEISDSWDYSRFADE